MAKYNDEGFLVVKGVLSPQEVELVTEAMLQNEAIVREHWRTLRELCMRDSYRRAPRRCTDVRSPLSCPRQEAHEMSIDDSLGGKSKQVIWNEAGWGTLGVLTRSERICGVAQALLGGPVRHYFNKRLLKKPGDPGVWQWCVHSLIVLGTNAMGGIMLA